MTRIMLVLVLWLTVALAPAAAQFGPGRVAATEACATKVLEAERQGIRAWARRNHSAGPPQDGLQTWVVRSHFNRERQRCYMSIAVLEGGGTVQTEYILDADAGNAVVGRSRVDRGRPGSRPIFTAFGRSVDSGAYERLMTR